MRVGPRLLLAGLGVLVALALAVWWLRPFGGTPLGDAVSRLPADTLRVSFTDWTQVAAAADGEGITPTSPAEEVQDFLARAFEQDLTYGSALSTSFPALAENFRITPVDAEWEVYGQARGGSVAVLRLGPDVDLEELEGRFAGLGYQAPADGAGSAGTWVGSPELVAGLDEPFTPVQENLAVVEDERLLVMADDPAVVDATVEVVRGDADDLGSVEGVSDLVSVAGEPAASVLWAGDFACEDLSLSQADDADLAAGETLVAEAGGVHPLTGLVFAQHDTGALTVGMLFESSDQAAEDLQPRVDLASGPAPGQGGTFAERFTVAEGVADGSLVRLQLEPVDGPFLSDLGQGPVLFATC